MNDHFVLGELREAAPLPQPYGDENNVHGRGLTALVRGTGSIGARHLRVLTKMGFEKVYAFPVRTSATPRPGIPETAITVQSWPVEPLDLIIIATDTSRHVADGLDALAHAPRALIVEKPLAADAPSAAKLAEHPLADRIIVSAPLRFHQSLALTRAALAKLGTPSSAAVESQSWLPAWRPQRDYRDSYSARQDEGGALRDLVHDIDYPTFLLGRPTSLFAVLGRGLLGIEAEESADMQWIDPIATHLRLDYVSPVKSRGIRITTDRGTIDLDLVSDTVTVRHTDDPMNGPTASKETVTFPDDQDVDVALARQSLAALTHSGIIEASSTVVFVPASVADGIVAVAICDAARRADDSQRVETVRW